jgi:putative acetyltransferase
MSQSFEAKSRDRQQDGGYHERPSEMNLLVRFEDSADVVAIRAVTVAAFLHAPHTDHAEHFIVDALRAAGALSISLVAEVDGDIVGHVAVSPVSISDGSTRWFGLGPISVRPGLQGQGIGTRLMHVALRKLQEQGAAGCVLLGDPAYYARFGFKREIELVFPDVPPEYFQAIAFGTAVPRGVVTYHAAFGAHG